MWKFVALGLFLACCWHVTIAQTYPDRFLKISALTGGLTSPPDAGARFGIGSAAIGDLDDDGVMDIAVSATNLNGNLVGAITILFMRRDGTVKANAVIANTEAPELDSFGASVSALGDLDDDGVEDIGVGAQYDDDGGSHSGAFWIIFMKKDGSVKGRQKISRLVGNFTGAVQTNDGFGSGSVPIGDLDGDGNNEMAVGARMPGVVYILFLNNNGTVKSHKTISSAQGLPVDPSGLVGYGLGALGDVDGDGVPDIAIGGHRSDVNSTDSGVVFVVFLTPAGGVKSFTRISTGLANFNDNAKLLGVAIVGIGDYDGDGIRDMVVGGDDTGQNTGAIWYMMLNTNGTVKSYHKISTLTAEVDLPIHTGDFFGGSLCFLGDLNNDGLTDIGVGAFQDDDGGAETGAIWVSALKCHFESFAGDDVTVCSLQVVKMTAILTNGCTGKWSTFSGSGQFSSIDDPNAVAKNLGIGIDNFIWTVSKSGCTPKTDTVKIIVEEVVKPDAGEDHRVCAGTQSVSLSGNVPFKTTAEWSLVRGSATISNPATPEITVTDLAAGISRFVWTFLGSTYCPTMKDTVLLVVQPLPFANVAMPDTSFTCASKFELKADPGVNGDGQWEVSNGNASLSDPSNPNSEISLDEPDVPVEVKWKVSSDVCPPTEDTAVILPVSINTKTLPNVITPNSDGKNDHWIIPNIHHFVSDLRLFNRWGEQVFSATNYQNDWAGGDLSTGMYFYYVTVLDCKTDAKGWLSIIH